MNNTTKYFISRCNELLNQKTFDSYRVSLHNPVSIFRELDQAIQKYGNNQIKRYNPTITAIIKESESLLSNTFLGEVFQLGFYDKNQVISILKASQKDETKIKSLSLLSRNLIVENLDFKTKLFIEIKTLLVSGDAVNI